MGERRCAPPPSFVYNYSCDTGFLSFRRFPSAVEVFPSACTLCVLQGPESGWLIGSCSLTLEIAFNPLVGPLENAATGLAGRYRPMQFGGAATLSAQFGGGAAFPL